MRTLTSAVMVAFSLVSGHALFAQQFSYSPPGVDFGNRYGLNFGHGVGFGYGVGGSLNAASGSTSGSFGPAQSQPLQVQTAPQLEVHLSPAQRAAEKQRLKDAAAAKQQAIEIRRAKAREDAKERNARIREFQEGQAARS
jgi:hypothetical protein